MNLDFNLNTILQIITLIGVLFAIYKYFRKPQEKSEINDAIFDVKFLALQDMIKKIELNDLHELKGIMNTHMTNQTIYEREVSNKLGGMEAKIDLLINK
jgi:hypothetical protein